jgi:hypothetical protein
MKATAHNGRDGVIAGFRTDTHPGRSDESPESQAAGLVAEWAQGPHRLPPSRRARSCRESTPVLGVNPPERFLYDFIDPLRLLPHVSQLAERLHPGLLVISTPAQFLRECVRYQFSQRNTFFGGEGLRPPEKLIWYFQSRLQGAIFPYLWARKRFTLTVSVLISIPAMRS